MTREELIEIEMPVLPGVEFEPLVKRIERSTSGFHEKSEKNSQTNEGGSYRRKIAVKYKKPRTRGQKPRGKK